MIDDGAGIWLRRRIREMDGWMDVPWNETWASTSTTRLGLAFPKVQGIGRYGKS